METDKAGKSNACEAQPAERLAFNQEEEGSTPSARIMPA